MKLFQIKPIESKKLSLDKPSNLGNNNATTKLTSAKPSRHTLAIFVPTIFTGIIECHHLDMSNFGRTSVYDGLIRPNTKPFLGNKSSRMLAVVETRCPMLATPLTKLTGICPMQTNPPKLNQNQQYTPLDENISLAKPVKIANNAILSQKYVAVKPNRQNWLFLRPNVAQRGTGVSPSYIDLAISKRFPLMVWLILQNKPVGEYAKRLLHMPRVRPHRPNLAVFPLTQNYVGVFQ